MSAQGKKIIGMPPVITVVVALLNCLFIAIDIQNTILSPFLLNL